MSKKLKSELPGILVEELCKTTPRLNAVLLIAVDKEGFPHIALLSYFEFIFRHAKLYYFINNSSRTCKYIGQSGKCSLCFIQKNFVYYVKARCEEVTKFGQWTVFRADGLTVLEDFPQPSEGEVFVQTGIRFCSSYREIQRRLSLREAIVQQIQE